MKITEELVSRTARLARLDLPEGEVGPITAELERILQYMDQLAELDTTGAAWSGGALTNVLRPDEAAPSLDRAALLAGAPEADGTCFLAPRAVE